MGATRWRWWYAGGLAALWAAQSLARLLFSRAAITVARYDLMVHLALIVAVLAGVAFVVALFPDTRRGRRLAAIAAVGLIAPLHAIASLFDMVAMVMFHLTGLAAPFEMIRSAPDLALSLLNSIGIDGTRVVLILIATLVAHVLLYLPVAGLLVEVARRTMAWRLKPPAGRGVALRWLVPPLMVAMLLIQVPRSLIWVHTNSFVIAPDALMSGRGTPGTAGEPRSDLPNARPLVLVIVDALRRDRMGVYDPALANTPFLTGLKASGKLHVFDPSFATCTFSYCGIMSVLASRSWDDFGHRPATIIDALGRHRYRSYLMMAGGNSRYSNIVANFGSPIALLRDDKPGFGAPADDRHVLAMLREAAFPDPRHSFIYIHLMSAHYGSVLQPPFLAAARNDDPQHPYALTYDARVRQADAVLRDIVATLRARGLGDALMIITADHGERVGEGGKLFHGGPPDPAAIAAPLLVLDPRGGGDWPQRPVASQIDVAPTLLAAVGGRPPPEWRGTALQQSTARAAVPIGTFETAGLVGVVAGRPLEYRCDRQSGREDITLLDAHGGGTLLPLYDVPHLLTLLRHWQRGIAPVRAGPCRR
jgi:hypothetical protein